MAMPFSGKQFTFTQPDGTALEVRGWGNQYAAVFETLDGITVTRNPHTGFYEPAQLSADGHRLEPATRAASALPRSLRVSPAAARAQASQAAASLGLRRCDERRNTRSNLLRAARVMNRTGGGPLLAPPQRGTTGAFVGLCLLIDFVDAPATISRQEVENFCNQPGYAGFGNQGSVFDYFHANSLGRCLYTNVVADYYRAKLPKSYYADEAIPFGSRAVELIGEALAHLQANNFNFSALTPDNAGFVYALNVFYAGGVVNTWSKGLWPHASSLFPRVTLQPGKLAADYQVTAMGDALSLGTFCHENGHMLCDYPDLYDYGDQSAGVGAFCLMCASRDEKNPPQISAYLKNKSGWAGSIAALQHNQSVQLNATGNQFAQFSESPTEYFLIENRARSGRDASIPDAGLAIWHVDELGSNNNEQMTPSAHYELSLEQADGNFSLERGKFTGDDTDLYGEAVRRFADSTTPSSKWWDGTSSNLELFEISAPGPVMSFRVRLAPDAPATRDVSKSSTPGRAIPDNDAIGVSDTIRINEIGPIASLKVKLDITHPYIGDLRVTLRAPWGASLVLHERADASNDDLKLTLDEAALPALAVWRRQEVQGDWTLAVHDLAASDVGQFNSWGLEFVVGGVAATDVVLEDVAGIVIPDNNPAGIVRRIVSTTGGSIAGIEVSVDITHPFIGDVVLRLDTPGGQQIMLRSREGGNRHDLVTTFTLASTPALAAALGTDIGGLWFLNVSDQGGSDIGKLNSWKIALRSA
jgi:M6 family metalloprotease-like protein